MTDTNITERYGAMLDAMRDAGFVLEPSRTRTPTDWFVDQRTGCIVVAFRIEDCRGEVIGFDIAATSPHNDITLTAQSLYAMASARARAQDDWSDDGAAKRWLVRQLYHLAERGPRHDDGRLISALDRLVLLGLAAHDGTDYAITARGRAALKGVPRPR